MLLLRRRSIDELIIVLTKILQLCNDIIENLLTYILPSVFQVDIFYQVWQGHLPFEIPLNQSILLMVFRIHLKHLAQFKQQKFLIQIGRQLVSDLLVFTHLLHESINLSILYPFFEKLLSEQRDRLFRNLGWEGVQQVILLFFLYEVLF